VALLVRRRPQHAAIAAPGHGAAIRGHLERTRLAVRGRTTDAAAGSREYLFAELHQTTVSLTTRLSYTFTPELSLQLYAQPFFGSGSYREFRRVVNPRSTRFHERFHTFASEELERDADTGMYTARIGHDSVRFRNPDFMQTSLRSNAVLRWEYRPGSTVFVVWSHGRSDRVDDGRFDFRRSVDDLLQLQGTNVLLVKVNYWLNR
jgi:hypothetical protein